MPTHPNAIDSIAGSVKDLISEVSKEERPVGPIELGVEWRSLDFRKGSRLYRRPETQSAIDAFRKRFVGRREWQTKWSTGHLGNAEYDLLGDAFSDPEPAAVRAAVQRSADLLDEDPPERVVILPIGGVLFGTLILAFPNIEIRTMTEERLNDLRQLYYGIVDTTQSDDEQKVTLRERADKITELLLNRVCASVTVKGDQQLCRDEAEAAVEPFIDFLQLMTAMFEPNFKGIRIRLGGDLLTRQPPTLVVKSDGTHINDVQKLAFDHRFEVDESKIDHMRKHFGPLFQIFEKAEGDRTEFETVMLRSMHWIADADRQPLPENKITSYITAIEMFFTVADAPVTRDISEGVAIVMRSKLEERRAMFKEMSTLYAARSRISHRGERLEQDDEVIRLKYISINVLRNLGNMSAQFPDLATFRTWMADQRLRP